MPFIPHTESDLNAMLATIGIDSIERLFDEIPSALRCQPLAVPAALSERGVTRLMRERAERDGAPLSFLGAGAYEHHIPAAVWELVGRGEFYTAYTPYQAEASQGTLQLLYEFQSMIAALTSMEVANASLYDGASALAEAVLMAVRSHRGETRRRVVVPATLHPHYMQVVQTLVANQGIDLQTIDYCSERGAIAPESLEQVAGDDIAALIIPQPNFFGVAEEVHALTDWTQAQGALVIGVVNPLAMLLLAPPGEWGASGADIACGEGQPLGMPLSSGGPYLGFLASRKKLVRQMPGRIVGRTVDRDGRSGYTLTLQAREQHIRRSKATSNICTNQGLMAVAATIHMALLGESGLAEAATASHTNAEELKALLTEIDGVRLLFNGATFHEFVIQFEQPLADITRALEAQNLLPGLPLEPYFPDLENTLLVCATETKSSAELSKYQLHLQRIMNSSSGQVSSRKQPVAG